MIFLYTYIWYIKLVNLIILSYIYAVKEFESGLLDDKEIQIYQYQKKKQEWIMKCLFKLKIKLFRGNENRPVDLTFERLKDALMKKTFLVD